MNRATGTAAMRRRIIQWMDGRTNESVGSWTLERKSCESLAGFVLLFRCTVSLATKWTCNWRWVGSTWTVKVTGDCTASEWNGT